MGWSFYKNILKPISDFFISLIFLILFLPIILFMIVFIAISNRGNVFFLQKRPGYQGVPFTIIKFKTMRDIVDKNGKPLPDEFRMTSIGRFVRSTSIDEILQLINVLKGDMSLIGPRPLMMQYLSRYSTEQARRHEVKPGITGWAQVNGRNAISWEQKFKLDIEYVEKISFILDCKILWKTFLNVIRRKDISAENRITMEEFMGSETNC